ncbi:MAG: EAL domain-containing protein [Gammaproteobacteria bacterium]|nr:EAL domain-containing protein [Gammaproteobacteria bacterium]
MRAIYSIKDAWHGLIVLVAFLPLIVLLIWVGIVVHNILLENALRQEKITQDLVHSSVRQEVSRLKTMMVNKSDPMAYILSSKKDDALLSNLLTRVLKREPSIHLLVLLDAQGRVISGQENYAINGSKILAISPHLEGISSLSDKLMIPLKGKVYVGSSGIHPEGVFITIAVPVPDANKTRAVLLAEVDANSLLSSVKHHMNTDGMNSYIVNESGILLVAPEGSQYKVGDDVSGLYPVKAIMKNQPWPTEREYEGIHGDQVYGSSMLIENLNWQIVTEVEREIVLHPIHILMMNLAIVSIVIVLLFTLLGMYLVKRVVRPIQLISDDFKRVGNQDFTPSTISSSLSELDSMVAGFNQMVKDIASKQQYLNKAAIAFENTSDGIVITDAASIILSVNRAFTKVTGYSEEDAIGKNISILSSGVHDEYYYKSMWNEIEETGHWQGEIKNRRKNGGVYTQLLSINSFKDDQGNTVEYIGVFADISNIKEAEHKFDYLTHHDPLTNLPNRLLCNARLEHELQSADRRDHMVAVMLLDLDMFKNINDSLGHVTGDKLLKSVTERLSKRMRCEDTISRIGGDEFVLIIGHLKSKSDAEHFAENIIDMFSESFDLGEHEIFIGASIGISIYPEDANDAETMMRNADAAMYRAKSEGRNNYQFYTADLTSIANERLSTEYYLRHALAKNELILHYQPQYSLQTGKMIAVEALIRWKHPVDGLVFPDKFISVAEETGLIVPIGKWVIETACKQLKEWQDSGCSGLRMAINLSARQFRKPGLASVVNDVLIETGISPDKIDLELTESIIMRDAKITIDTLNEFHQMGVELSIDDFGTGYSSLSYLKKFPITRLKIDRSFVRDITIDKDDAELINSIIALGHCMNLKVLAEGVEDIEQLNYLKQNGCDEVQGYFYSKPIPADELEILYKQENL